MVSSEQFELLTASALGLALGAIILLALQGALVVVLACRVTPGGSLRFEWARVRAYRSVAAALALLVLALAVLARAHVLDAELAVEREPRGARPRTI